MAASASQQSRPRLVLAAHGTESPAGAATTADIAAAVSAARPDVDVTLCFVDVLEPSLATALDAVNGPAVVVPLLLSAGYHVQTDIPAVAAGRPEVRVARHLGPDPAVADALARRLAEARSASEPASTALVAIGSSRGEAREEVERMAQLLADRVGRSVSVVPLFGDVRARLAELRRPVEIATYLLAEGTFWDELLQAADGLGTVAAPIGAAPELVALVLARYEETVAATVR